MPGPEPSRSNTVAIMDVVEQASMLEVSAQTPARFAGGADGILREQEMNPFRDWATLPSALRVYRLRDVVLDRSLMVLLKHGQVIAETNYLQSDQSIAEARVRHGHLIRPKVTGILAPCFDHWDTNYYHWLAHAVPTVHAIRQRHTASDIALILPQLRPWQEQSLELLGVSGLRRIETEPGAQYSLPEVEYYDFVAGRADFSISPLSRAAYARMSTKIEVASPRHRRIYIDRGATTNRCVPNEAALIARLSERGFHVVRPEELSLRAQIALFKGASMVVGQLGAGLANIAFCQPGTIVYELVPQHHQNPCFLAMALQGGLEYWADVFATGVEETDHTSRWTRDIDVGHVIRRIDELEAVIPR